jgi:hypothetical protein
MGLILILVAFAFLAGIIATIWGPTAYQRWQQGSAQVPAPLARLAPKPVTLAAPAITAQDADALEARVAALNARLDGLAIQAQNAGAYASRAEALMIAFAARRALDTGAPLGYLEGELRVRFAQAQPRAVATIITAAHEPVTLADLQAGLSDATPALMGERPTTDWWAATKRELANLIIIRKANAPSRVPQRAVEQARTLLLAGRTEAALAEVERLPGHMGAESWVQMTRRYNEARRALDVIEAAAILETRSLPETAARTASQPTVTSSALAPDDLPASNATEAGR